MNPFIFGLSHPKTLKWLADQWDDYPTDDVDSFIEDILLEPGTHIRPSLSSTEDDRLAFARRRYFDSLKRLFSLREIRKQLKLEFLRALTKIDAEEGTPLQ